MKKLLLVPFFLLIPLYALASCGIPIFGTDLLRWNENIHVHTLILVAAIEFVALFVVCYFLEKKGLIDTMTVKTRIGLVGMLCLLSGASLLTSVYLSNALAIWYASYIPYPLLSALHPFFGQTAVMAIILFIVQLNIVPRLTVLKSVPGYDVFRTVLSYSIIVFLTVALLGAFFVLPGQVRRQYSFTGGGLLMAKAFSGEAVPAYKCPSAADMLSSERLIYALKAIGSLLLLIGSMLVIRYHLQKSQSTISFWIFCAFVLVFALFSLGIFINSELEKSRHAYPLETPPTPPSPPPPSIPVP